jgi:mono/diheme cytochrome c family protein
MTHLIVTRVSFAVCLLALACAVLFAALAGPASAPAGPVVHEVRAQGAHPGAALFDRHCARCHSLDEAVDLLRDRGPDLDAGAARVREFLLRHGAADAAADAQIVAYLREHAD